MDRYHRNQPFSRPYQSTCGMNGDSDPGERRTDSMRSGEMRSGGRRPGRAGSGRMRRDRMETARAGSGRMDGTERNVGRTGTRMEEGCCCRLPENESPQCMGMNMDMQNGMLSDHTSLGNLPLAMAYVPMQRGINETYRLNDALRLGTIFPELCKPFCGCGKRGGGR